MNHQGNSCQIGAQTANWVAVIHIVTYNSHFSVMLLKQLHNASFSINKRHFTCLTTNDSSFTLEQHRAVDLAWD